VGITQDESLRLVDPEHKVVGGDGQDVGHKTRVNEFTRSRRRLEDAGDLAAALVCVLLLLVAVRYADLDSNFATSIPLTSAIRQVLGLPAFDTPAGKDGKFILVAEKDNRQRLIAKTTLERCGYTVALADSGSQAIEFFRRAAPRVSLVLLDRSELRSSADSVVFELKRIRPDIRILVSQPGNEQLPWGVTGRVAKPLSAPPLTETVRKVLASN
jgi:CheY-like chemotaxis protein